MSTTWGSDGGRAEAALLDHLGKDFELVQVEHGELDRRGVRTPGRDWILLYH